MIGTKCKQHLNRFNQNLYTNVRLSWILSESLKLNRIDNTKTKQKPLTSMLLVFPLFADSTDQAKTQELNKQRIKLKEKKTNNKTNSKENKLIKRPTKQKTDKKLKIKQNLLYSLFSFSLFC